MLFFIQRRNKKIAFILQTAYLVILVFEIGKIFLLLGTVFLKHILKFFVSCVKLQIKLPFVFTVHEGSDHLFLYPDKFTHCC